MRFELRYIKRRNKILRCAAIPLLAAILPLYLIEKAIINLESEWSWFPLAFLRGLLLRRRFHFELDLFDRRTGKRPLRGGPLARCIKIPWIAELQDPIVFKDWTRSKTALRI